MWSKIPDFYNAGNRIRENCTETPGGTFSERKADNCDDLKRKRKEVLDPVLVDSEMESLKLYTFITLG